ncbi:TerB N-terminal domain-containing protein [Cupriavidus sp. UYPR2.512]|uniref:TerB N-terminal domain-containing protein n=1 Tax=Cupriavidus sp. UYPR2.512 TaxID=1080187 RepID=UPI00036E3F46|nr:TerB N-terminal domain-containing protein [Cupriavidus sp. UYPR2.512]UIF89302.1 TerB N-terminal domain-containing protein [Cupriavidus necator]
MPSDNFFETELTSDKPELFVIRSSPQSVRPQDLAAHWVPPGMRVNVHHYSLSCGLVYLCGNAGRGRLERVEPSLIDESLEIGKETNFIASGLPYFPTFEGISPDARSAYLNWLASGRRHPKAAIGYVYLFFYGLERRAVIDARTDPAARDEIPAICVELEGLIETYRNGTFNWRARQLLAFCHYMYGKDDIELPVPPLDGSPPPIKDLFRIVLARCYHNRRDLPAAWLAVWYLNDHRFTKLPVVKRHPRIFAAVFQDLCSRQFGKQLANWAPPLATRSLQLSYTPVSPVMREVQESLPMPDVTAVESGLGQVVETIAKAAADTLTPYSRYLNRSGAHPDDPVARLMLPCPLWPAPVWERLALTVADLNAGVDFTEPTTLSAFLAPLEARNVLAKLPPANLIGLMNGYMGIGMEPDPRHGAFTPDGTTPIILFRSEEDLPLLEAKRPNQGAELMPRHSKHHARVACVVFLADLVRMGLPNADAALMKATAITRAWEGLSVAAHDRLQALLIVLTAPGAPALKGKGTLKKQLDLIDQPDREPLTQELVAVARAGDALELVSVVRQLEKYFALLGAHPKSLYEMAHTGMDPDAPASSVADGSKQSGPLDTARIVALRKETAEVDSVLISIFAAPVDNAAELAPAMAIAPASSCSDTPTTPVATAPSSVSFAALPSLDSRHSDLLRDLVDQDAWASEAFAALCTEHGLMPSGAIEKINDAAFDAFDEALLEGDDPFEFNPGPLALLRSQK